MNIVQRGASGRRVAAAGLAAVAMMLLSACGSAEGEAEGANAASHMPVIAHRGGAMARPENTLAAFRHASELGVDVLEFDMLMTADDQIVIYHDGAINPQFCKPANGGKAVDSLVRSMTLEEIRQLDCGSGVREAYDVAGFKPVPGAGVPTLDEVFSEFAGGTALFFPETKVPPDMEGVAEIDPVKFASLFNEAVVSHGLEDRVILQSFDFRTIDALNALNPRIRTCLLGVQRTTKDYLPVLQQHNATCIVLGHEDVDAAGVQALQEAGVLVYSGVADDAQQWQAYVDLGVDALFSNDPENAITFLQQSGLRQ